MPFHATNAANWSSIIRIGAKMAVIRRRIARRAVSSHTQRAGTVPYGGIPDYTNETGDRGPLAENALGTLILPEEVANIATFLASGAARHATGTVIDINGASFPR